jgi:hypothetical protein
VKTNQLKTKIPIKIIGALVAVSLAGNPSMAQQAGAVKPSSDIKGPVKVFILAGQSNMEGHGVVSMDGEKDYNGGKGNLVWSMEHSKSAGRMKRLKDEHGEWVVRDTVILFVSINCRWM